MRRGAYPGSFNPPTIGHMAIALAARRQRNLDVVILLVSRVPLAKTAVTRPVFDDRLAVLQDEASAYDWLDVAVTDHQLIADIARGFDAVVMGADKWHQIHDVRFYGGSVAARDEAIAALPEVAIAPRPGFDVPKPMALAVPDIVAEVSSSGARAGNAEWMSPAARRFDTLTGAWSDPDRYDRWRLANR